VQLADACGPGADDESGRKRRAAAGGAGHLGRAAGGLAEGRDHAPGHQGVAGRAAQGGGARQGARGSGGVLRRRAEEVTALGAAEPGPTVEATSDDPGGPGPTWARCACSRSWAAATGARSTGPTIRSSRPRSRSSSCVPGGRGRLHTGVPAEARKLARVRHPNVVPSRGGRARRPRGIGWTSCAARRSRPARRAGPSSPHEAACVGITLCRALAAVHRAGLVHRDVKAANVMREHAATSC